MLVDLEVEYRLLGSLEVRSNGRVADLGPRKQRVVLAVLLLHAGEIVSTDRLIELVWGRRSAPDRGALDPDLRVRASQSARADRW